MFEFLLTINIDMLTFWLLKYLRELLNRWAILYQNNTIHDALSMRGLNNRINGVNYGEEPVVVGKKETGNGTEPLNIKEEDSN